jgi:hypothetical protein
MRHPSGSRRARFVEPHEQRGDAQITRLVAAMGDCVPVLHSPKP